MGWYWVLNAKWERRMTNMTKPMLSGKLDWAKLRYPVLVSPKIDGIRCVVKGGEPMSRTWKVLPNHWLQEYVAKYPVLEHMDGEIVVGRPTDKNVYNKSMSGIMARFGHPDFLFMVFDYTEDLSDSYALRRMKLQHLEDELPARAIMVPQRDCRSREEVEELEATFVADGYEGIIVRSKLLSGRYKQGRSTVNEGFLLKLKRYEDSDAVVTGYVELMHNENEATIDEQGHTKRSSHKANQVPGNCLGALTCMLLDENGKSTGLEFSIGSGFDQAQRDKYWKNRHLLTGKIVKFKHMPHGALVAPRHPIFLGFRSPIDVG
jgi:DNA ligase-1